MKITKQYNKVCDSCKGNGIIPEPFQLTTSITRECPACNGLGVVIVTEVSETPTIDLRKELIKIKRAAIKKEKGLQFQQCIKQSAIIETCNHFLDYLSARTDSKDVSEEDTDYQKYQDRFPVKEDE